MNRTSWTALVFVLLAPATAHATQGHKTLISSWTMNDTHWGNITIAANNVTLDCRGNQIHSSSNAAVNCLGNQKCAIFADGFSGVTVTNCYVVGGAYFQHGVLFRNMRQSGVFTTTVSNTKSHAFFIDGGGGSNVSDRIQLYSLVATNVKDLQVGYLLNGVGGAIGRGLTVQGNTRGHGMRILSSQQVGLEDISMYLAAGINGNGVGLEITNSTDVYLGSTNADNTVHEFSTAGVRLKNSTRVALHDFQITKNEGIGLHLRGMTSTELDNVTVDDTEDSCGCETVIESDCVGTTTINSALGIRCPAVPDPLSCAP